MSPEDQSKVNDILNKKYGDLTNPICNKHARIALEIEDFIQSMGLDKRDFILSLIIGQIYMDTTLTNDEAIYELKKGDLINKTIAYIVDIDNVLSKGG